MYCNICKEKTKRIFKALILDQYDVSYYYCPNCEFLHTEEPYWMEDAYKNPINTSDTGMLSRNINLSRKTAVLLYFIFDKGIKCVDYAGGYGIFTRLMRDIGFDFYWYDLYTQNLFAKGYDYTKDIEDVGFITSFESFEHLVDPIRGLEEMLKISTNIFFSTELLPQPIPAPKDWWYYGLSHGQHISFYSYRTLKQIAEKFGLNLCSNKRNLHMLTQKKINNKLFKFLLQSSFGTFWLVRRNMEGKASVDREKLILKGKE